jgi:hypothetical protein
VPYSHWLKMEVHLQSLFGLHVMSCAQLYSLAGTPQLPPSPCIWTRITRALLVSKYRRHLFVTHCLHTKTDYDQGAGVCRVPPCAYKLYSAVQAEVLVVLHCTISFICLAQLVSVLWIRIGSGFNGVPGFVSGSGLRIRIRVVDPDPHESIFDFAVRIRIRIGNASPDPGAWKIVQN